jgi:hypothetical protein
MVGASNQVNLGTKLSIGTIFVYNAVLQVIIVDLLVNPVPVCRDSRCSRG